MSAHNVFPLEELNQRISNVRSQMVKANIQIIMKVESLFQIFFPLPKFREYLKYFYQL